MACARGDSAWLVARKGRVTGYRLIVDDEGRELWPRLVLQFTADELQRQSDIDSLVLGVPGLSAVYWTTVTSTVRLRLGLPWVFSRSCRLGLPLETTRRHRRESRSAL